MEHQSNKFELKVGLFIAAGVVAIMASILLLGGDKVLFTRYMRIHTHFSEVQGLFPGSVVSLAGLAVGNVDRIDFVPGKNQLEVVLKINEQYKDRLFHGTEAEVRTQGALGDKFVYLNPGEPSQKLLANGDVIQANETDFMKLLTSREDGVARVVDLIKELHILISSINANGQMAEMTKNMAEASQKAKTTLTELDGLLGELRDEIPENKKLKKALTSLANVMEKIDQGQGTLGQLVNDPSVHQNLKAILGGSPRNNYMKSILRETIKKSGANDE